MSSPIESQLIKAIIEYASSPAASGKVLLWDYTQTTDVILRRIGKNKRLQIHHPSNWINGVEHGDGSTSIGLYSNVKVDAYRVDILLTVDERHVLLAIECDGHDWHERTKQQASSDRARDRALLRLGLPTIRFTGSDIFARADECASEAIDTLASLEGDLGELAAWHAGYETGERMGSGLALFGVVNEPKSSAEALSQMCIEAGCALRLIEENGQRIAEVMPRGKRSVKSEIVESIRSLAIASWSEISEQLPVIRQGRPI